MFAFSITASLLVAACGNSLQKNANYTEDVTGTHSSVDIPSLSTLSHTFGGIRKLLVYQI